MTTEFDPIDNELEKMSSNPRIIRAVKDTLQKLSDGAAGPDMAEMAKDLIEGRTSLRQIGDSSAYASHFAAAATGFRDWQARATPEESDDLARQTIERLGTSEGDSTIPT